MHTVRTNIATDDALVAQEGGRCMIVGNSSVCTSRLRGETSAAVACCSELLTL
jgi:hypothetical protein